MSFKTNESDGSPDKSGKTAVKSKQLSQRKKVLILQRSNDSCDRLIGVNFSFFHLAFPSTIFLKVNWLFRSYPPKTRLYILLVFSHGNLDLVYPLPRLYSQMNRSERLLGFHFGQFSWSVAIRFSAHSFCICNFDRGLFGLFFITKQERNIVENKNIE